MEREHVTALFSETRPNPRLTESDVTVQRLESFLDAAVFDYIIDDDGDIYIKDGTEFPIWLSVDREGGLIHFHTFWRSPDSSPDQVNKLNVQFRIVQFALSEAHIAAHYYLPFRHGVDARHIVIMARKFGSICRAAHSQVQQEGSAA